MTIMKSYTESTSISVFSLSHCSVHYAILICIEVEQIIIFSCVAPALSIGCENKSLA